MSEQGTEIMRQIEHMLQSRYPHLFGPAEKQRNPVDFDNQHAGIAIDKARRLCQQGKYAEARKAAEEAVATLAKLPEESLETPGGSARTKLRAAKRKFEEIKEDAAVAGILQDGYELLDRLKTEVPSKSQLVPMEVTGTDQYDAEVKEQLAVHVGSVREDQGLSVYAVTEPVDDDGSGDQLSYPAEAESGQAIRLNLESGYQFESLQVETSGVCLHFQFKNPSADEGILRSLVIKRLDLEERAGSDDTQLKEEDS